MAEVVISVEKERQGEPLPCEGCNGTGDVPDLNAFSYEVDWKGGVHDPPVRCSQCRGSGYVIAELLVAVGIHISVPVRR